MTDEQQETIVNEALRIFCTYLNFWWDSEEMNKAERSPYTPEKFTTWDPEHDLYGQTDWVILEQPNEESAFPTAMMKIDTTDGDEGGGSILYVGLQGEDLEISYIVHIFDLTPTPIYFEGEYRTPPDGELKKP